MSSEPPRRPPYQPPAGGAGGGGSYSYPSKPMKRPRDTGAGRDETADAEAAEAATNAPAPPNLRQLRGENARRWEEVVRLRGRLVQREAERRQATHGPVGDGDVGGQSQQNRDQRENNANHNSNRLGPLDRRLAAHRAEMALLVQPQQQQQQQQQVAQQPEEEQQQQSERNVRAIQAHRSMIQNARRHQAQLYGNEIVETYDGLAQLHAHLDRTIGAIGVVAPRDNADEEYDAEENGTANADGRVRDGAEGRDVLTLHDRIAEAEARVVEHRLVHTALVDMLQRRRRNGAQDTATCSDGNDANEDVGGVTGGTAVTAAAAGDVGETIAVDEPDEAQRIHAEMVYFAQRFDVHLDRMEEVAATAAQEEREGDTLSDDEDGSGNDVEGSANRVADNDASDRTVPTGTNSRSARSSSTSSSSSQNPFLATLFVGLARRAVSNREDPYVSLEATIGAATASGSGGGNSSRGRNRRIRRRRRIVDHLLAAGVLTRHSDNPDLICFNYFE